MRGMEMTDEKTTHKPYSTITHYTCSLTLPDDETHITITTKTAGVSFASSTQDAVAQTIQANGYSKSSYASYILRYVRDQLLTIDVDDAEVVYTDQPTITAMTEEDLQNFQRDVISANG